MPVGLMDRMTEGEERTRSWLGDRWWAFVDNSLAGIISGAFVIGGLTGLYVEVKEALLTPGLGPVELVILTVSSAALVSGVAVVASRVWQQRRRRRLLQRMENTLGWYDELCAGPKQTTLVSIFHACLDEDKDEDVPWIQYLDQWPGPRYAKRCREKLESVGSRCSKSQFEEIVWTFRLTFNEVDSLVRLFQVFLATRGAGISGDPESRIQGFVRNYNASKTEQLLLTADLAAELSEPWPSPHPVTFLVVDRG